MHNLFSKQYEYILRERRQEFIVNLKNNCENSSAYVEKNVDKDFIGNVTDESFTIKAVPSSSRRRIFNPIICGSFIENNDITKLFVIMKLAPFDYAFISLYIVLCFFFELIIYLHSFESDLNYFVYLIPLFIFIAISILFFLFAKLNFRDAKERLESILDMHK